MTERTKKALILTACGVAINVALAFIKLFVGIETNSLCIMLDSMNGFFDIATGVITVIAFILCAAPKSEKFPYGKGRSEYVAGFIVSAASVVMGALFFFDSLSRIAMPEPIWFGWENFILVSVGIPLKVGIVIVYKIFNKKLKSKALAAIAADSLLDVGITTATMISFAVSPVVNYAVDSIFGMVISVVVIGVAIKMVADNLGTLTGAKGCIDERNAIISACKSDRRIAKIIKMDLHDYGYRACVGTVKIEFTNGTAQDEKAAAAKLLCEKIKEDVGAEIEVIG